MMLNTQGLDSPGSRLARWLTGLLLCCLLTALALIAYLLLYREQTPLNPAQENTLWAAYQIDRENLLFRHQLELLKHRFTPQGLDATALRFDLLYSRVDLIRRGRLHQMLNEHDESAELVQRLLPKIRDMDALVPGLVAGDRDRLGQLQRLSDELADAANLLQHKLLKQRAEALLSERSLSFYLILAAGLSLLLAVGTGILLYLTLRKTRALDYEDAILNSSEELLEDNLSTPEAIRQAEARLLSRIDQRIHAPIYDLHDNAVLLSKAAQEDDQQRYTSRIRQSADQLLDALHDLHQLPTQHSTEPRPRDTGPTSPLARTEQLERVK